MAWANLHQAIFGNHSDSWIDTYRVWVRLFDLEGVSELELESAVIAVSRRASIPRFAAEHLEALREEIRLGRRKIEAQHYQNSLPGPDRGTCQLCGDAGIVCGLPHLKDIRGSIWGGRYTVGIVCRCLRGKWFGEKCRPNDQPLMGLDEYELHNPDWRGQLRARAELREFEARESGKWRQLETGNPLEKIRELARNLARTN
jgi:hypothetical protein